MLALIAQAVVSARVDALWPTSVSGWLTLSIALFALGSHLVSLWRADKRPILAKIEELRVQLDTEVKRLETDAATRRKQDYDDFHRSLNAWHETVTREINGWAKRFEDHGADIDRHELAIGDQALRLVRSESDRENLNRRVEDLAMEVAANTKETRELERSMTKNMGEMERRIVDAIKGRGR